MVLGWAVVLYYLNDFFAILSPRANIKIYYRNFNRIYSDLGLRINYIKDIIGLITEFLEIKIDSNLI